MDPTYELIKECIVILKENPEVSNIVGDKIYDRVPEKQNGSPNVASPYISIGNTNLLTEDFDCVDSVTISLQFNCWCWGNGEEYSSALVRKLSFYVRKALNKKEINLNDNGFVSIEHRITAFNRAADGITHQASITFEVLVDIIE